MLEGSIIGITSAYSRGADKYYEYLSHGINGAYLGKAISTAAFISYELAMHKELDQVHIEELEEA